MITAGRRTELVLKTLICVAFMILGGVALWVLGVFDAEPAPIQATAVASNGEVPYVTDTEAFIEYLQEMMETIGPEALQVSIKEMYADAPYGEQHMAVHYFGEELYTFRGAEALPLCEDWYGFGCYHGFLLDAIDTEGYAVVPFLDTACIKKHGNSMETETCQHGIGHGLLEYSRHDPHAAIEACDLVQDVYPKLGCASGVFMEYFSPTQSDSQVVTTQKPPFDPDQPYGICKDLTGLRLSTCLFEIQSWWQDVAKLKPVEVEALCNAVEDEDAREFCLIGYGNFKGPYVAKSLPFCEQFVVAESHALCRAGMLWSAEHHYELVDPTSACDGLAPEHRATCFEKGRFTCEVERRCREGE